MAIITNCKDIIIILFFAVIIRLYYYSNITDSVRGDSPSYLNYSSNILNGEVNSFRTPIYPYFIKTIKYFGGQEDLIHSVIVVQSLIAFLTIIVFYYIAKKVLRNRYLVIASTFLCAASPTIVNFDKCILTESLSISFMIIFIGLITNFLNKPTIAKAGLYSFSVFLAVMLRPSFIILLPIILLFWFLRLLFRKQERKISSAGIFSAIICSALIIGYSELNFKKNGLRAISSVSIINQIDQLIVFNMTDNGNDREISKTIKDNRIDTLNQVHHFEVTRALFGKYSLERISAFTNNSVRNQPLTYLKKTIVKLYLLANEEISTFYAIRKNGFASPFNFIVRANFITFLLVYIAIFLEFLYLVFHRHMTKKFSWFRAFLWMLITSQLALVVVGAPSEYQRLFVVAMPCLIILLFLYLDMVVYAVAPGKLLEYISLDKE